MVPYRHKIFISYHHDEDQKYADILASRYEDAIIDKSLYGDFGHLKNDTILNKIRKEHLRDSTVTVVLVGLHTYGRKWVDWEIYASLRPYADRTRNGLLGVYLPDHSRKHFRLTDNILTGYGVRIKWKDLDRRYSFSEAVHNAWKNRRYDYLIDNSRPLREKNAPIRK
jgi:hypothetical protein